MANYTLIIAVEGLKGDTVGYTMDFDSKREALNVIDEAKTSEYDFDTDEDYEEFVENASVIFGEVEVATADERCVDYAPCFAAEDYLGHALFEDDSLIDFDTIDFDTSSFFETVYHITRNDTKRAKFEATVGMYANGNEDDDILTYTAYFGTLDEARAFINGDVVGDKLVTVWNFTTDKLLDFISAEKMPFVGGIYYAGYTIRKDGHYVEGDDEYDLF